MTLNIPLVVETWKRERDILLREFPELADDPETLNDTLEGITGARDAVGWLVRRALEDEERVASLGALIRTYQDRMARFDRRATSHREAALRMMQAIGDTRIERPEATISRAATPSKVIIPDEAAVPDMFCRTIRKPNVALIKKRLETSSLEPPNWASLSLPGETLRIGRK